jgi:hypothetical protein
MPAAARFQRATSGMVFDAMLSEVRVMMPSIDHYLNSV